MYRRKVKGAIMGGSKTGSIVYIEPETTLQYSRELNNLEYEEGEEVVPVRAKWIKWIIRIIIKRIQILGGATCIVGLDFR